MRIKFSNWIQFADLYKNSYLNIYLTIFSVQRQVTESSFYSLKSKKLEVCVSQLKEHFIPTRSNNMNWNITAHCFLACYPPPEPKTFQVCIQTPAKAPHLLFLVTVPMDFSNPPPKHGNCFPEWHNSQTAFPETDRKGLRASVWVSGDQFCHSLLHDLGQINQPPCCSVNVSSNELCCYARM